MELVKKDHPNLDDIKPDCDAIKSLISQVRLLNKKSTNELVFEMRGLHNKAPACAIGVENNRYFLLVSLSCNFRNFPQRFVDSGEKCMERFWTTFSDCLEEHSNIRVLPNFTADNKKSGRPVAVIGNIQNLDKIESNLEILNGLFATHTNQTQEAA